LLAGFAGFARGTGFAFAGTGVAGVRLGGALAARKRRGLGLVLGARRAGGLLVKTDGLEDFLPEAQFGRSISARRTGSLRTEFLGTIAILAAALGLTAVAAGIPVTPAFATVLVLVGITVLASA
jgi:hypothetical protein